MPQGGRPRDSHVREEIEIQALLISFNSLSLPLYCMFSLNILFVVKLILGEIVGT